MSLLLQGLRRGVHLVPLVALAASLHGCTVDIPRHTVGNWQAKPSYIKEYEVTLVGTDGVPVLNSCSVVSLDSSLQCSGHGSCANWFEPEPLASSGLNTSVPLLPRFCHCDRDWAGPECDIQRKSQFTAFLLSMFGGVLGADMFYLGLFGLGVAKLLTFGGLGVWWIFDVARIGSSAVAVPGSYRVAADVEHWVFLLSFLTFTGVIAFVLSIWSLHREQHRKAREILMLKTEGAVNGAGGYGSVQAWSGGAP